MLVPTENRTVTNPPTVLLPRLAAWRRVDLNSMSHGIRAHTEYMRNERRIPLTDCGDGGGLTSQSSVRIAVSHLSGQLV